VIPPLVSFKNYESFEFALVEQMSARVRGRRLMSVKDVSALVEECRRLHDLGLPPIASGAAFGLLLGVSPKLITSMSTRHAVYWRTFYLPKKSGGSRLIRAPRTFLKTVQNYILETILSKYSDHEAAYGFTKGKGAYKNATQHLNQNYVWNTDIVDFFPSISADRVQNVFVRLGYSRNVSWMLAILFTYEQKLAQGAPTSPKISNIITSELDELLASIAGRFGCNYTRYADDITFSSMAAFQEEVLVLIKSCIEAYGFVLNEGKTRSSGPNVPRYVTGFVINAKVQPDRATRRTLRAKFHRLNGIETPELDTVYAAQGWASYVYSYNKDLGRQYLNVASAALGRTEKIRQLQPPTFL